MIFKLLIYIFQRECVSFLKDRFNVIRKIFYFSDGCAAQYKNKKNFYNLSLHKEQYGIEPEWSFFITSHWKNVCDGLGGTLNRLVTKASLRRPYNNQIKSPQLLFEWAKGNIQNMNFVFISTDLYKDEDVKMKQSLLKLTPLPSTRKMHQIIPLRKGVIKAKQFSFSQNEVEHTLN